MLIFISEKRAHFGLAACEGKMSVKEKSTCQSMNVIQTLSKEFTESKWMFDTFHYRQWCINKHYA